jgi:hypothetical protein
MLGFMFNVANLPITIRYFKSFTLGLVYCLDQCRNLGSRTNFSNLNFRKWHVYI